MNMSKIWKKDYICDIANGESHPALHFPNTNVKCPCLQIASYHKGEAQSASHIDYCS